DLVRLPLFANSDGQRLSIEDLQAEYRRRGYLSVSPASSKRAAPGVLWTEAAPGPELRAHFPHRIRVDAPPRRRLAERGYVLRVPLPSGAGEMGLRADCLPWLRTFSPDGECTHQYGVPFLDVASDDLPIEPGDLYYCLLESTALSPELQLFHSLGFVSWLTHAAGLVGKPNLLLRLLDALPRLSVATSSGSIDPEELSDFIHAITIPSNGGPPANLVQMARNGGVWFWSSNYEVGHGVHLLLSGLCGGPLTTLLAPTTQLAEAHYSVPATRALKAARNPQQLLQRLCTDPECAAYHMIAPEDRARLASLASDDEVSLRSLIVEARKTDAMVQTPALLEALRPRLEVLGQVEFLPLERSGARRLHESFECYEPRPDSDDPKGICLHHIGRAWFQMWQGGYDEARRQAELAVAASESIDALSTLAITTALTGDVLGSLPIYERALEISPETPSLWSNYAEDLALAGRSEQAWGAVEKALSLDSESANALGVKASLLLESKPEDCWKLCEQLIREAEFPVSVWETRALAAERLGRLDDARQSWRKFLEGAWVETLLENNLPERRARAEERLARLATA
ncbi:MAG: tetratricopeptide repeat protein, partial [Candidatus Eremiobacteraeota bacterium]|nr:tetratricopeptide repeat protein [Candidatus Eremiobacteraeota bacterium]